MNLIKMAKEWLGPGIIMDTLENQDPRKFGADIAKMLKDAIVNELGMKGFLKMRPRLIAWFDGFYITLRKRLLED